MTERTDLDLGPLADTYDVPRGDLDAVLRRSRHRSQRHRRGLATLAAVSLVGTAVAVPRLFGEDDGGTSVATAPAIARGTVGITWSALVPGAGLGWSDALDATTPLYALSTAPGQRAYQPNQRRVVWRSDDGVEWTAVASGPDDFYLSDLAASDGRVYAVGTGPAVATVAGGPPMMPLLVGWSDDGAETWSHRALPVALGVVGPGATTVALTGTEVAVSPRGVVVAAVVSARFDAPAAFPAGVTAPAGWALSDDGVDILGPETTQACPADAEGAKRLGADDRTGEVGPVICGQRDQDAAPPLVSPQEARGVVRSLSWAELGVEGDLLRAVRDQPVVFFAPAGSDEFRRVDVPGLGNVVGPLLVSADDDGFDLIGGRGTTKWNSPDRAVALHSPDGVAWTASEAALGAGFLPVAAGRLGGVPTMVGNLHMGSPPDRGPVLVRADGSGGWTSTSLTGVMDAEATAGKDVYLVSAGVGDFGVVAAVMVAPKDSNEPGAAMSRPSPPEYRILASRDGVTWTDAAVDDLAGRAVRSVLRAGVVGRKAVVAVSTTKTGGTPGQLVLVGTPD